VLIDRIMAEAEQLIRERLEGMLGAHAQKEKQKEAVLF
jgi:hypothetical protein